MENIFFTNPNLNIQILSKGATRKQIECAILQDFKGKEDFIRFYLVQNGVFFPDGAVISTEMLQEDDAEECYEIEIEYMYSIEHLIKMWEAIKMRSAMAKKFIEMHIPFARDAAGNEFFIEIPTGMIKYISWEYDIEEGLSEVASSFKDFYLSIKPID